MCFQLPGFPNHYICKVWSHLGAFSLHGPLCYTLSVHSLFKIDAKFSPGCLASVCGFLIQFLFNSYSKLMQMALQAALHPPAAVSYSIIIQIRWNLFYPKRAGERIIGLEAIDPTTSGMSDSLKFLWFIKCLNAWMPSPRESHGIYIYKTYI